MPEQTCVEITVRKYCTQVIGTSAGLVKGDILTVQQLFYGLLLPSGNDVALVLADYFGKIIESKEIEN